MYQDILVIIPAYNEEFTIGKVIKKLKKAGFENIAVVNDGSTDNTSKVAQMAGANVLNHPINIGVGGATATGIEYAKYKKISFIITVDADNQHHIDDIKRIAREIIKKETDVVVGSRLLDLKRKYKIRYLINYLSNWFTYIISGKKISDSQSGLRAFNRKALHKINIQTCGYEASSEIIRHISAQGVTLSEIPIKAIYSDYSLAKGQRLSNGIGIITKLLIN